LSSSSSSSSHHLYYYYYYDYYYHYCHYYYYYHHYYYYQVLGIEAARAGMLEEIRNVLFFDGGYINYRHMSVLVDVMTFRGNLVAVSRHGINRGEQGPLLRASFEETMEVRRRLWGWGR